MVSDLPVFLWLCLFLFVSFMLLNIDICLFVPFFCLLCFVLCEFGPGAYFHFNGCIECLQIHNLKNLDATVVLNNK